LQIVVSCLYGFRVQWTVGFPTIQDRINMARAAYEAYAESDGTSLIDFALDVLLLAQSERVGDKKVFPRLAKQALREWSAYARGDRRSRRHAGTPDR